MTASIISPLVPPKIPAGGPATPARDRRTLPLPQLPGARSGSLICGMAAVDRDGRISDVSVIGAMGWSRGTGLDVRVSDGLILVSSDGQAAFRVTRPGQVRLSATVRHRCGLTGGSRVLLVAYPALGTLVVQAPASLDAMVNQFHAAALGGDAA